MKVTRRSGKSGSLNAYVAVTDNDWFSFLSQRPEFDEVNFWTPSGNVNFKALDPGQPFLFKLHHPLNYIVGGGFFGHFSRLPVSLAWDVFGEKNGAESFPHMRSRIEKYRKIQPRPGEDYVIGCILLEEPFFLDRDRWIEAPPDFSRNIVRGKGYDLSSPEGRALWDRVTGERALQRHAIAERPVYGEPIFFRPRLGQGSFRVVVLDAYGRQCSVTAEKALPTLQAAHIRPVSEGGQHRVDNGLLLRSDVHALFDRGYVTVTPDLTFRASRRLKEDFHNGEHYFQLAGQRIRIPDREQDRPARELLEWHADTVFKG